MRHMPPNIRHDFSGFRNLVQLYEETKGCFFRDVHIDMGETTWFDADMCALFGAILYYLSGRLNTIKLNNIHPQVETVLSKNGFLSHYGREKIPDRHGTTISYQHFDAKDDRYFARYIEKELIHRSEIPVMSLGLLKKFRGSIFEIFSNAVLHSRTEMGIFSCGQFFPKRNRLDFSVADLGVGMRQNIKDKIGLDLSPEEAIDWTTRKGNTTKRDQIPGGLGLKLLCEFIDMNGGSIQIVSDAGYWQRKNRETTTQKLNCPFPGTVVTVEINTADTGSYMLTSELNAENIF